MLYDSNHQAHEDHEGASRESLARCVIEAGLEVHRALGPGLMESAYEHCLAFELAERNVRFRRQVALPIMYKGVTLDAGYRLDLIAEDAIIIEIKAIDALSRVHEAQLLTYLKLSGCRIGFLMNFNAALFKQGLKRLVL
ncbi:MAG TPA: GxxExxY protein [Caulobacteraceae bacterium]|nr:GxxExxY protein [Caulobacteraceae bacterium]